MYGAIIGLVVLSSFTIINGWGLIIKGYAVLSIVAGYMAYKYIPETASSNSDASIPIRKQLSSSFFRFTRILSIEILVALWVVESKGIVIAVPVEEALVSEIVGENIRGSAYGLYLFISSQGQLLDLCLGDGFMTVMDIQYLFI